MFDKPVPSVERGSRRIPENRSKAGGGVDFVDFEQPALKPGM